MPDPVAPPQPANPNAVTSPARLVRLLATLEDGRFAKESSDALQQVTAIMNRQSQAGGKPKASLTITLSLAMEGGAMEIRADLKVKTPKVARPRTFYYPMPDGTLRESDVRQGELPLNIETAQSARVVETESAPSVRIMP